MRGITPTLNPVLMLLQVLQVAASPMFLMLHLWSCRPLPQQFAFLFLTQVKTLIEDTVVKVCVAMFCE